MGCEIKVCVFVSALPEVGLRVRKMLGATALHDVKSREQLTEKPDCDSLDFASWSAFHWEQQAS